MKFKKNIFALLLTLLMNQSLSAQENVAILVANQNYLFGNKLKNPINDVEEIKFSLKSKGFKTIVFKDLTFEQFNGELMDSIKSVIKKKGPKTKLFFHYAGHGLQLEESNFLVPVDFKKAEFKSDIKRKCFPLSDLFEVISELISKDENIAGLISIDACRNNPFISEGVKTGFVKPSSNYNIYHNFSVMYSVTINQTAKDGKGKLSPFARALIKSIDKCDKLSQIPERIHTEYVLEGISEKPYFEGNGDFSFCAEAQTGKTIANNWKDEYNNLIELISVDYENGEYAKILQKAELVNSLIQSGEIKADWDSMDFLKFELEEAVANFQVGNFDSAIPKLELIAEKTLSSEKIDLFSDAYFYLTRYLKKTGNWKELKQIRFNQLKFQTLNHHKIDAAITLDKIAGDYEGQNMQDSAFHYYFKALSILDNIQYKAEEEQQNASLIYGNIGKCYGYGAHKNIEKAIDLMNKALKLAHGNTQLEISNLQEIIGLELSLDTCNETKMQLLQHLFNLDSLCKNQNNTFNEFYLRDLQLTFYMHYKLTENVMPTYYNLINIILRENKVIITENKSNERVTDNNCTIKSRKITIKAPSGALPILFFDKNENGEFDDFDYKLSPAFAERDTVIVTEFGHNSAEQWEYVSTMPMAMHSGVFSLTHNNAHLPNLLSDASYCLAYSEGEYTIWQFQIDCSELNVFGSSVHVGVKNSILRDQNQILPIDQVFRFVPISPCNEKSTKYSFSTGY